MERLVFTLVFLGMWAWFGLKVWSIVRTVRAARPAGRNKAPVQMAADVLRDWLGQAAVFRDPRDAYPQAPRSWHHPFIFWSFLYILPASVVVWLRGFVPSITNHQLPWWYRVGLDGVHVLVLALMAYAVVRRLLFRPPRMHSGADAYVILALISILSVTHLVGEGAASLLGERVPAVSAWVGSFLPQHHAHTIERTMWWIHALTLLGFLVYLPYSKHVHILTSIFAIALRDHGPRGVVPRLDLMAEDDDAEPDMGPSRLVDLTRKDVLDIFSCTECSRCSSVCPKYDAGLSPMDLILSLRRTDPHSEVWNSIDPSPLWECLTCGACEEVCPVGIEHTMKIVPLRTNLVLEKEEYPPHLAKLYRNLERFGNPWGMPAHERGAWMEGLDVPIFDGSQQWLLWVGCASSLDPEARKGARAAVSLLAELGISFGVLGGDEPCCGDPARRTGNEFLFQMITETNVEMLGGLGVKRMIFLCPHGLHVFKNEYPQFGLELEEAVHYTQILARHLDGEEARRLGTVTFHDPCYLGRRQGEGADYDSPRALLGLGFEIREPKATRELAMCCGGGGGGVFMESQARVEVARARQLVETGADTVAVACPMCRIMLTDAMKRLEADGLPSLEVMDVSELVRRARDH